MLDTKSGPFDRRIEAVIGETKRHRHVPKHHGHRLCDDVRLHAFPRFAVFAA
jgi:hypothetical protein